MLSNIKIGSRLYILSGLMIALSGIIGSLGIFSLMKMDAVVESSHDRQIDIERIMRIRYLMSENRSNATRALQHEPSNPFSKLHDHSVTKHTDEIAKNRDTIDMLWKEYMGRSKTDEEQQLAKDFEETRKAFVQGGLMTSVEALKKGDYLKANEIILTKLNPLYKSTNDASDRLMEKIIESARAENTGANELYRSVRVELIITSFVVVLVGIFGSFLIIRSVILPVNTLKEAMSSIERDHDLSRQVKVDGKDEIGETVMIFNRLLSTFQKTVTDVIEGAGTVANTASELSTTTERISRNAHIQSEKAASVAAATEEITVSIDQVSEGTKETHRISEESRSFAEGGMGIMERNARAMEEIARMIRENTSGMETLANRSGEITAIVNVIKEIADQTNLLALNAAIEAARAGEQGRGFAVVADEVRKLAERTTKATQEIANMIGGIQTDIVRTTQSMRDSANLVEIGVNSSQEASESLSRIKHGAIETDHKVSDMTNAVREQATASTEIARNVEQIAQMTEQTSEATHEAAGKADELAILAKNLREQMGQFRV
ncbi:MAG: methyl-accepting chemotaxis protein [Candidatus Gracilibacteria bacterium]|nr:methyl-accepting chemotaxis protein [Candidatus Gracilibacteria bacterium]